MARYDPFSPEQTGCDGKRPPAWFDLGSSVLLLTLSASETQVLDDSKGTASSDGSRDPVLGSKRSRPSNAAAPPRLETNVSTPKSAPSSASAEQRTVGVWIEKVSSGIFSPPPVDDRVLCICDFIAKHLTGADIEIEAKLGTVIDLSTALRAALPGGSTATCLESQVNQLLRFESQISFEAFKRLNDALNQTVAATLRHRGPVVRHTRSRHVDRRFSSGFRETRPWARSNSSGQAATATLASDDAPLSCMFKTRVDTLHILFPQHPYDVRVNAAREQRMTPVQAGELGDVRGALESERHKDRLSYRWACFSVDITVVQQPQASTVTYEVEVELNFEDQAEFLAEMLHACADYRQQVTASPELQICIIPPGPLLSIGQILFETLVALNNMLVAVKHEPQTTKR
jgi:hypothetical protein